ncbi:hypothetical protein M0804_011643 [Polistes exclamans]|nr:hypothetical protein M0804_011643 [Polistes exclamans]
MRYPGSPGSQPRQPAQAVSPGSQPKQTGKLPKLRKAVSCERTTTTLRSSHPPSLSLHPRPLTSPRVYYRRVIDGCPLLHRSHVPTTWEMDNCVRGTCVSYRLPVLSDLPPNRYCP